MASVAKKACVLIGTHDGNFHCDEVMACWMLKQLPQYKSAEIVRTRDNKKLEECDIVVDVGGVYDPEEFKFDHHQKAFVGTMKSLGNYKWDTKLSSAGLVYLHFGKEILSVLSSISKNDPSIDTLYEKVYEKFIEAIDGVDNGIDQFDGEPRYQVTTSLSSRVADLNPAWNEENGNPDDAFRKAMEICGAELSNRVLYYKNSWLPARQLVEDAINKRHEVFSSGEIVVFSRSGCPWKEHLLQIEEEQNIETTIKFVLYQDNRQYWRVQCVPKRLGSFENRVSLCSAWCGLRDEVLSKESGIPDCIFVHANGFIGGNKTYDGALKMASLTLESNV